MIIDSKVARLSDDVHTGRTSLYCSFSGSGNIVSQAVKLRDPGIKNKKQLNDEVANMAIDNELPDQITDK